MWAGEPSRFDLAPGYPVKLLPCGPHTEAKIYEKKEGHGPQLSGIREAYDTHVANFKQARENARQNMLKNLHLFHRARVAFFQWNAEFLSPTAFEIVQSFIPGGENRANVDEVDVLVVAFQELNNLSDSQHEKFIRKVVGALNALSTHRTWSSRESKFKELSTVIGTKAHAQGWRANRQAIYTIVREGVIDPQKTRTCSWSFHLREKGFVAVSLKLNNLGRFLAVGVHLPTKKGQSKFLSDVLDEVVDECVPSRERGKGLEYFAAGVYVLGDYNSRLSAQSAQDTVDNLKDESAYCDLFDLPPTPPEESVLAHQLLYMTDYERADKESRFAPILWAADSLGGADDFDEGAGDLRESLLQRKFSTVTACYAAPFSFKWQKSCVPGKDAKMAEVTKRCLTEKSKKDVRDTGFLDRLSICMPNSSIPPSESELPRNGAFVTHAEQLLNLRSDHLPQLFIVDIIRRKEPPFPSHDDDSVFPVHKEGGKKAEARKRSKTTYW
ncbi:hypothetical protein BESB_084230 [Besnoitia besnoiti]|uniref:Endonuclease/exonuclease/phosphatase family protein n=1 Tax=Besnoitia besnoiti TaxID=94643 RepID=A0A2A9M7S1_BESBE|nr:hypothetical protein BESB_084230 [Besnoitia besnoiti]PFH33224.1 hypothetical protein BESB_084230 [Besnoitia besnoiti]